MVDYKVTFKQGYTNFILEEYLSEYKKDGNTILVSYDGGHEWEKFWPEEGEGE